MIYITQLIYIQSGKKGIFQQYESIVLPLLEEYSGKLELRLKIDSSNKLDGEMNSPDEIHVVSFPSKENLEAFLKDDERKKYVHLKNESVAKTVTLEGIKVG